MVPFESLGMICYSPSIVIMAVSLAILEIFSVKEWPDLEIWVWGRSRSFKNKIKYKNNKKVGAADLPGRPLADIFLYVAIVPANAYQHTKFQLSSSINFGVMKGVPK